MNMENGIFVIREVVLIIWTLTIDSELGMFNRGGGVTVGGMIELRKWTRYTGSVEGKAEDHKLCL